MTTYICRKQLTDEQIQQANAGGANLMIVCDGIDCECDPDIFYRRLNEEHAATETPQN